jgi:NO-binding membrane sensor protein with MHYT domain
MQQCEFLPQEYTPASASLASGVQVQAMKPTAMMPMPANSPGNYGSRGVTVSLAAAVGAGVAALVLL